MKRLAVFVFMAVLICSACAAESAVFSRPNPEFVEWQRRQARDGDSGAARTRSLSSDGEARALRDVPPSPADLSYLDSADFSEFIKSAAEEFAQGGGAAAARSASSDGGAASLFPRRYDMCDYGFLTPVRNQSALGVCWAFSSCASMESNLLKKGRGEYDLSEWQLGYQSRQDVSPDKPSFSINPDPLLPGDWNDGIEVSAGNNAMATAFLARGTGPVFESEAPYPCGESSMLMPLYRPSDFTPKLRLRRAAELTFAQPELIKAAVVKYGAVSFLFNAMTGSTENPDDSGFTYWYDNYFYSTEDSGSSHLVAIVGWDDDYSVDNFREDRRPSKPGAWIARNSWGELYGEEGYFYISYEEGSLKDASVYDVETRGGAGEYVYEYDPLGQVGHMSPEPGVFEGWGANVYTARGSEVITAVGFYSPAPGAEYELSVETGLAEGSPRGDARASAKGTQPLAGYVRVELHSPVSVSAGEDFSVVLKLKMPEGFYLPPDSQNAGILFAYEYAAEEYTEKAKNNPGKSFYSADGAEWESMGEHGDLCIKAFASEDSSGGCSAFGAHAVLLAAAVFFAASRVRRRR